MISRSSPKPERDGIAIVGIGCRYPDAGNPNELWEMAIARRRAFRAIPAERLRLDDYPSDSPDGTYVEHAAVIDGFELDRVKYRVVGDTYRVTDLAHWLALDTAARALADAGLDDGQGLNRARTGVVVGNSLNGEFTRAAQMRLRWPYVRRTLTATLEQHGIDGDARDALLADLEVRYKAPFAEPNAESLAGGLANTIAGRICNQFDFGAGGYTVDGACSSSLLAIADACRALEAGDVEAMLVGGVDLSLDPFELVGFARTGALARELMRVYDRRPTGFWPGEGCGFVVLTNASFAARHGLKTRALIRGWGVSSDGSGGLTRPATAGQRRALDMAYAKAGYGIASVHYFEGHGTGTAIGDEVELRTISGARREDDPTASPARIGSIKANFGHTKAASGIAALIKATLAVAEGVRPPTTGVDTPHPVLSQQDAMLEVGNDATPWPAEAMPRAGISSMGFGGINVHIAIEGDGSTRRTTIDARTRWLQDSSQDTELFVFASEDRDALLAQVRQLEARAAQLAYCELADASVALAREFGATGREATHRAAVVASSPRQLAGRLAALVDGIEVNRDDAIDGSDGFFYATRSYDVGLLFPGQGTRAQRDAGAFGSRYADARRLFETFPWPDVSETSDTRFAQPAITALSLATVGVLERAGLRAVGAVGHSLGEIAAWSWAGALAADDALELTRVRGVAMAAVDGDPGKMAAIIADSKTVEALLAERQEEALWIAGLNAPEHTVISGQSAAVDACVDAARARGLGATVLRVSHAFHSPLLARSIDALQNFAKTLPFTRFERPVLSTINGQRLLGTVDPVELLEQQVTAPVRFQAALTSLTADAELLIEVGPGRVLASLAGRTADTPVLSTDTGSATLERWFHVVAAAFVAGALPRVDAILVDRFARPFDASREPRFFTSPCERAELDDAPMFTSPDPVADVREVPLPETDISKEGALGVVRQLLARATELPVDAITETSRLLDDLHLNSIAVGALVVDACRALGLAPPKAPSEFADATVAEVANALDEWQRLAGDAPRKETTPQGLARWIRCFVPSERALEAPRQRIAAHGDAASPWQACGDAANEVAKLLSHATQRGGLIIAQLGNTLPVIVDALHAAVHAADDARQRGSRVAVVLQEDAAESSVRSMAKTLALEVANLDVLVMRFDANLDTATRVSAIADELETLSGYRERRLDAKGVRFEPVLEHWPLARSIDASATIGLDANDHLLISGGGKGIACECGYAIAKGTGVRLLLVGRSDPARDAELASNLARLDRSGIDYEYLRVDLTDADATRQRIGSAHAARPITAVLHGAGFNQPCLIRELECDRLAATMAPKVGGLEGVLSAIGSPTLKWLITFSSVIARAGMRGECDYALANQRLTELTERYQCAHPSCRCLALEWSVWSGVGMGERLGRIEALEEQGIDSISPDRGIEILLGLMAEPPTRAAVVVTGRLGGVPTLPLPSSDLPLARFLERPRLHIDGIELVVDATLQPSSDPYLEDHVYRGERVLPGVIGLEAMAQVAMAVTGERTVPIFSDVRFERPTLIAERGGTTIRLLALVMEPGVVDVALRSAASDFAVDHFRARCEFSGASERRSQIPAGPAFNGAATRSTLAVDALYGSLLFQSGRFRRLAGYRRFGARFCVADLEGSPPDTEWFRGYHPSRLELGDPGRRDAALHAIQVCVPEATLLPIAVERIEIIDTQPGDRVLRAVERSRKGNRYSYDLEVENEDGEVAERWTGLQLQTVAGSMTTEAWLGPLIGPYLERRFGDAIGSDTLRLCIEGNEARTPRGKRDSAATLATLLPDGVAIERRPDGKPIAGAPAIGTQLSAAHHELFTLATAHDAPVGCDVESVVERGADAWQRLLGEDRFAIAQRIAVECGESIDCAATRVWCAYEACKKAGWSPSTIAVPRFGHVDSDDDCRRLAFDHPDFVLETWALMVRDTDAHAASVVVALLAKKAASKSAT